MFETLNSAVSFFFCSKLIRAFVNQSSIFIILLILSARVIIGFCFLISIIILSLIAFQSFLNFGILSWPTPFLLQYRLFESDEVEDASSSSQI